MITKEYLQQELVKRIDGYKRGVETTTDNIIAEMKSILVLVNALQNYEKKYNEALERFKSFKEKYYIKDTNLGDVIFDKTSEMQKDFNDIFPELREEEKPLTPFQQCLNLILHKVYYASVPGSIVEDVDKFVLGIVKNHTDELVALAKKHEYTDCQLRESKEEKIRKYLIDELKAAKSVGELKFIIPQPTREECIAYLEKQKEQKHPNGCFTCDEYKKGYEEGRRNGFTAGYNKAMKEVEQKEQKPWKVGANAYFIPEQKPAEWSEEDKTHLGWIIECFDSWKYQVPEFADQYQSAINWLKSLRHSWKPSEEQMEVFQNTMQRLLKAGGTGKWYAILESLYEQLKKL